MELSTNDIIEHSLVVGIDAYPPIALSENRTRLNMFYEEARSRAPDLFDQLVTGETVFRISTTLEGKTFDSFVLTDRGPVFRFPLLVPPAGKSVRTLEAATSSFHELRELFFSAVPDRQIMRFGMVQDVFFGTGTERCFGLITDRGDEFSNATLDGAQSVHVFRDPKCNIRITLEAAQLQKTIKSQIGPPQTERSQFGLHVVLDVNSFEVRPQSETDIEDVITRAGGLWPESLLEFVNERRT